MFVVKKIQQLISSQQSSRASEDNLFELDTMNSPEVKIEIGKYKPKWYVNFADFANMVKAFIGSNYLTVAFAFAQSGLALGIVGMLIIALLTDHCCHLIVKTKHYAINKLMQQHAEQKDNSASTRPKRNTYNSYDTPQDSGVDDDEENDEAPFLTSSGANSPSENSDTDSNSDFHEHIVRNMSYGDVGKLCYGSKGIGIVNFAIALTQFGFCVAYFIFIGNTVHSLFPSDKCEVHNGTTTKHCTAVYPNVTENRHGRSYLTRHERSYLTDSMTDLEPFIDTKSDKSNITTITPSNITTLAPSNMTTIAPNVTTIAPSNITTANMSTTTTSVPWKPEYAYISRAPDLRILVAGPLVIFVLFSLIRNVRYLGVISVIANLSILFGCVSVFIFLIINFKVYEGIVYFKIEGFAVFFGMVTSAFEGIGLVIPIESSMVGNRHLFSYFLHGAIGILGLILGCFGIMGYLKFGSDVHQMLNTNIPPGTLSVIVNLGICFGILLTFPLQIFPVIEITERYLFAEGRIFGPKKEEKRSEEESLVPSMDTEPLLGDESLAAHIPDSVATWKRNILRIFMVLCAAGLAILLRHNFAYVGAFVGAVGSSMLAYILPCLFHLKMCWHDISVFIKVKDIIVVVFGIFASIISVVSVIQRIVQNFEP